jgi:glyceraldehyde 3-phosphate dehydrogenase
MALKIAINGFGRIGRCVMRIASTREDIKVVAINDMADKEMMLHLLKYDSVHGTFDANFDGIDIFQETNPKNLDFASSGADVVLECTGLFLTEELVKTHIKKGVKKVILSAPAEDSVISTFVMGVNHKEYKGENIISNASCTTNCLAPIASILDEAYGIEKGLMTTIHSYTNDQNLLDVKHNRDIRRSRAAAINMIPTTTGAAKALSRVLPQLEGKLDGTSIRVPTPDVSMVDLTLHLSSKITKEEVIKLFHEKAEAEFKGLLMIDQDKRVSQDFVGSPFSSIIAEDLIQVMGEDMVGIRAWYDNEWGYSNRLLDMAIHISK